MNASIKRWRNAVLNLLIACVVVVVSLVLLATYNPMRLMFITSFTIENHSDETIRVLPVGVYQGGGLGPLHETHSKWLPVPVRPQFVEIRAHQSEVVTYDWDDVNFCWLALEGSDGKLRLQPSGLSATNCPLSGEGGQCCRTRDFSEAYVVEATNVLPVAPEHFSDALRANGVVTSVP